MQHVRHSSNALRPAYLPLCSPDAKLILVRASTPHNDGLIDRARVALHANNPGASLLRLDTTQSKYGQGYQRGFVSIQLLEQPWIRSRLLAFPPHETLGHIALNLLSQGIPVDALNAMPIRQQRYPRIGNHDLLLLLPHECGPELPFPCLH